VVLDVGGVGYDVEIPLSTFYVLAEGGRGAPVSLYVHTHVREDALQLYGFNAVDERTQFRRLIGISGVGPRLALAILSGIGVDELERAVLASDRARLQKIRGVGKKTAERLLLELRDKIGSAGEAGEAAPVAPSPAAATPARADAISALVNLGYAEATAARAVDRANERLDGDPSLEGLLRGALTRIVG
jgi:Holliday junction DNA helicase RuvA